MSFVGATKMIKQHVLYHNNAQRKRIIENKTCTIFCYNVDLVYNVVVNTSMELFVCLDYYPYFVQCVSNDLYVHLIEILFRDTVDEIRSWKTEQAHMTGYIVLKNKATVAR